MPKKHPNIVLFAIDSIRRDHMSCYGYERNTTPHMDALAAEGTLFQNAFAAYIPTTPSYSTMLTGRDVFATQQPSLRPKHPLFKDQPTLPEILRGVGYTTTCIGFDRGFFRGFNKYDNFEGWVSWEDRPARKAENLNDVALPALERMNKSDKPFLLFLRHMDPHAPYLPPAPFDTMFYDKNPCARGNKSMKPVFDFEPFADFLSSWMPPGCTDKDYVIAAYDGALAYMDACIQRIINRIQELGIEEETLIIITGDHGETLYDHEIYFDHHGLYECTLIVPLIFHCPGKVPAGARSQAYTLEEDLVPTILDLCGIKSAAKGVKFDGKSNKKFMSDLAGSHRSEFFISECTWMRKQGWRTPTWKYWEALEPDFHNKPPVELYNLADDPEEANNLAEKEPEMVKVMKGRMDKWIKKRERQTGKKNPLLMYELGLGQKIGSIATAKKLQSR
jgi:arylsulfatase A-like enzyme